MFDEERPYNLCYFFVLEKLPDAITSNDYEFIVLSQFELINLYRTLVSMRYDRGKCYLGPG